MLTIFNEILENEGMEKNKYPNRLQQARERTELTQQDLANALINSGVDPDAKKQKISKIENGRQGMTYEEMVVFSKLLDCDIEDIMAAKSVSAPKKTPVKPAGDITPRQEIVRFTNNFVDLYEALSPEAKALAPDFILPALGIRPEAHMVIPARYEDDILKKTGGAKEGA